jgi:4-amino-4-deoxy-L-arabinose transferase-like glycosyltransferase
VARFRLALQIPNKLHGILCRLRGDLLAASGGRESFRRILTTIVIAAFAIRVGARIYMGARRYWDEGYTFFFDLAQNIAAGKGIGFDGGPPTAFRVPLYPMFLAVVTGGHKLFLPVVFFQSLIGAGTALMAALVAQDMFGDTAALIAGVVTAFYPYYVVHDTALQETSLYTFLAITAVLLLLRAGRTQSWPKAMLAGCTLGATVLTRANLAPFAIVAPMCLAFPQRSRTFSLWRGARNAILCLSMMGLTISPWLIRSYLLTGTATLSTQSGYFLWLGNNAMTFSRYPIESIDRTQEAAIESLSVKENAEIESLGENEAAIDQWYWRKGAAYMREHPWETFSGGLRKIEAAFAWLPSPRPGLWKSVVHMLSYGPIMILGLWGMWSTRHSWRRHLLFYVLFLTFIAVTAVFFGHTNYRSYLDVYLIIFAAGVLSRPLQKCANSDVHLS